MKVPNSWLRSYCDPGLSVEELADELAMHSVEVERISHVGAPSPDAFVVGRVLSVEKHPDADKLSVCEVDTGDGTRPHYDVDVRIGGGKVARLKVDAETRSTGWRQPAIVDE